MNPLSSGDESAQQNEAFVSAQDCWAQYRYWIWLALKGEYDRAEVGMLKLLSIISDDTLRARVHNDVGVFASLKGWIDKANREFATAISLTPEWPVPRENRQRLSHENAFGSDLELPDASRTTRVAIVSLLLNCSTAGDAAVHSAETGKLLTQAGYLVRHFYAEFPDWGLGNVTEGSLIHGEALRFTSKEWTVANIQARFRAAIQEFDPDWVIVTDSWNSKPILAEAVRGYRYFLHIAGQECLCPLNNVRLRFDGKQLRNCPKHQLATPDVCSQCVLTNGRFSAELRKSEREFVGYGSAEYDSTLRAAFVNAEAVLVVNPLIKTMVGPYAKKVYVIPGGFDPARFSLHQAPAFDNSGTCLKLLFAGLMNERINGFEVLHQACDHLWKRRRDFELLVTADPPGQFDEFTRFIGWQPQSSFPQVIHDAAILVIPTVAEEALGRTAVEAMGVGRPVIASRIGGLQFTVADEVTGLLCEPGDYNDLARKIEVLLDNPELRQRMGQAGRQRFEEHFTWKSILRRYYLPLLGPPTLKSEVAGGVFQRTGRAISTRPQEPTLPQLCSGPDVVLGCVLAVQNRPASILERTFQTFAFQSYEAADRVLLDYGSSRESTLEYLVLCQRYGWRLVRAEPPTSRWNLSSAYNLAVSCLIPEVNVVFKGDVDVLIDENVLETAARIGKDHLCIFSCQTTSEGVLYPYRIPNGQVLREWHSLCPGIVAMDGEGIHAYPRRWFEEIGGFDLQFGAAWGFEDSDLRLRASWSIGVSRPIGHLLIHQWHPRALPSEATSLNYSYYQSTKERQQVIRNCGRMTPPGHIITTAAAD